METAERIKLVRIIEKMNENKEFSKKLGIRNESKFKKRDDGKGGM